MIKIDAERQRARQGITVQHPQVNVSPMDSPPHALIAGTSQGVWILDAQPRLELENHPIHAIAASADGLWAIVNRNSIWHRPLNRPLNGEWHQITAAEDLRLNCILPFDETVLVGTSEAHLMEIVGNRLQRVSGFEQAEGRQEWYTPWGGLPDVRSLAIGSSGERYVNIHVGGILRLNDQGRFWGPTLDMHADVHQVQTVHEHPGLVLAATAQGLAISKDGGNSWEFDRTNLHSTYARAVAVSGDTILMSVSQGPGGAKAALYRRQLDQPGTFTKCTQGLPEWFSGNIDTGCLAALGSVAAFGTEDGQIFWSRDAGLSWERITGSFGSIHSLEMI
jgi:hypothetical protein